MIQRRRSSSLAGVKFSASPLCTLSEGVDDYHSSAPRPRHSLTLSPLLRPALRRTLQLARLLKDKAVEAQACYSLGNTYTLLQDYERAIDYHLKHLVIAQNLSDRYGSRWCVLGVP